MTSGSPQLAAFSWSKDNYTLLPVPFWSWQVAHEAQPFLNGFASLATLAPQGERAKEMNEVRKGRSHFVVPKVHGGRLAGVLSRSHDVSFQLKKSLLLLPILCLSATTNCGHVGLNYVDD